MPPKVLLIESESAEAESIETALLDRGCEVITIRRPFEAASQAMADWPDLIVVNACSGLVDIAELCQALDDTRLELPRLVIARDELDNHCFADAHLGMPFTGRLLTQRIKKAIGVQANRFLRVGDITLDGLTRRVQRGGHASHLTPKEFRLLYLLMLHAGEVLNRRIIMKEVWDTEYLGDTRTLDVHVRWVREKLEDDPSRPRCIITVRGVGYRFSPRE
ncbi:MAG: hypothetical protein A2139_01300 [Desulfobacca sp. RBG_16_60_12]|nr:MAG: hypothetical protein A2139_01300 [Desulfobacca sp. RBG_16_60_12]